MHPFKDKHIAIVGASGGIGLALTRLLRAQGASLYTFSRNPLPPDLSDLPWTHTDIQAEGFSLTGLPDTLHGFVYTPGTINLRPFSRIPVADFRQELEVNAVGAFHSLQQAFPALRAGRGSALLFSTVAAQLGMPFHAGISAAKGAVEGMVRALAAEWAPAVRINAIAPSLTDTPLAGNLLSTDEKRQAAAGRHPLRRVGTPGDMAEAACFLLDPDRSGFITGQVLAVDGGMGHLKT